MRKRTEAVKNARPGSDLSDPGRALSGVGTVTIQEIDHGDSRALVDVDEGHSFWETGLFEHGTVIYGAIVRLCPPARITDAQLADAERQMRALDAAAVKVNRREQAAPGVLPQMTMHVRDGEHRALSHREVVDALLARVKTDTPEDLEVVVLRALEEGERQSKPVLRPRAGGPLYVKAIRLMNWQRFHGQHVVELEPTVYAVTAEHEEHAGRSNWLGKSSFLGVIPFAFFGWHTRPREDAWITDGEDEGGVAVTLSDGTTVQRARTRGKATRLVLRRADGTQAHGDEAEREIAERVGLTQADFFSTSFFVQKAIGQFVTMQPSKRQELVAGWLDLGPLRAAEEWAREQLDEAATRESKAREAHTGWEREAKSIEQAFGQPGGAMQVEATIEQFIADREAALKEAQERAGAARAVGQVQRQRQAIEQAVALVNRTAAELGAAEQEAAGIDRLVLQAALDGARETEARARSSRDEAARDEADRRRLLVAGFDGRCPVAQIECPATAVINARREEAKERHAGAKKVLEGRVEYHAIAAGSVREHEQAVRAADMKTHALRERRRAYEAAVQAEQALGPMPPEVNVTESPEQLDARVRDLAREIESATAMLTRYRTAQGQLIVEEMAAFGSAKEVALYGLAARLLGRGEGGAQREVALSALGAIEASTNASLAAAGVELSVSLRWGTESSTELAGHCGGCGASLPASKRVKSCPRCGATRGAKLDEKLDFVLSDRSGAAEDLAGFHLQIAAAAWLYGRRGVPWRVIAVDEPFGALDEAHRRSMGSHVAGLLRSRYAFEQAFVIAHDTASTDAMPARIRIIAGRDGSRIEVES